MFKKLFAVTALSAIATVSYAASAQAANFTYSSGGYRDANVKNQGSFSQSVNQQGYETFDFNGSTTLPGNDRVKYSYEGSNNKTQVVTLNNSEIKWAPAGVNGEKNESQYLQVFQGKSAVIETVKKGDTFNYFGLNLGALSGGNTLEFFNAGNAVEFNYLDTKGVAQVATTLTYNILTALAPTSAQQHGGQTNGFFEFFSEGFNDNFDKIVISQVGGGGFETDNHTFRIAKGKYSQAASVPEPSIALGILAIGGSMFVGKRKQQKSAK
ncbi:MAG: PEP-CTERM sorting domain-containing protein [Richelia sp. SL_2_1]|nr:PEP-CTERM sorting domain-containing protein [Richelia sp. SL_2_1]